MLCSRRIGCSPGLPTRPAGQPKGRELLRLVSIGRRFAGGVEALRDVSLAIGSGDFVALLGPSGCGKSTLLRVIAGLDRPDSGRLEWAAGQPPAPGEIGFVFQDPNLLPWASAEDNVFLPLRLRGFRPRPRVAGGPRGAGRRRAGGFRARSAAPVVRWDAHARVARPGAGHPAAAVADG